MRITTLTILTRALLFGSGIVVLASGLVRGLVTHVAVEPGGEDVELVARKQAARSRIAPRLKPRYRRHAADRAEARGTALGDVTVGTALSRHANAAASPAEGARAEDSSQTFTCRVTLNAQQVARLRARLGAMMPELIWGADGRAELRAKGYRLGELCLPLDSARLARFADQLQGEGVPRRLVAPADVVSNGSDLVLFPAKGSARWAALLTALESAPQGGPDRHQPQGRAIQSRTQMIQSL